MQNTSSTYKRLVKQSGRTFRAKIICTFSDGTRTELTDGNIMQSSLKISSATSNEGSFDIGCAIINELDFEIDNSNGNYTNTSFSGAEFDVRIGLTVSQKYDGTTRVEWLRKGIYTAEEITVYEKYISVTAYDYMAKLDVDFPDTIAFPVTAASLLSQVCTYCGIAYGSLDFYNADLNIESADYLDESVTCRDIISYIAQTACSYAYIDTSGCLNLGWYTDTDFEINERQRLNGTVTVTGVQITDAATEEVYQIGTTDYCLVMDSNPLVQKADVTQNSSWNDRLVGLGLTPFEASVISDPCLEAGDTVTIYDLHGNSYRTPITSISYMLDGKMTVACDAETLNEKQRSTCSVSAKIIAASKKETQKQLSEYNIRAQQFSQLTANSMGYYQTVEEQDDGSVICYQHDKPLLTDSTTIWKKSGDTLSVSADGGETWTGFDKDGNAVFTILAAEGIVADWINAGTLQGVEVIADTGSIAGWTLEDNTLVSEDGSVIIDSVNNNIIVNDDDGNKMLEIDKQGVRIYRGDTYIGFIGTTTSGDDTKGIAFGIADGDYMSWTVKDRQSESAYDTVLNYNRDDGLTVKGGMSISGGLSVAGSLKVGGDLTVNGGAEIGGGLGVYGGDFVFNRAYKFCGYTLTRGAYTIDDDKVVQYWGWEDDDS